MGCGIFEDPTVSNILKKLEAESKVIIDTAVSDRLKYEAEKGVKITERKGIFTTKKGMGETIGVDTIKQYNKEEFECDRRLISNEKAKIEKLLKVGIDLAKEFRAELLKKLNEKIQKAPEMLRASLRREVDELTNFTDEQFLGSSFGKPLLSALEKLGMSSEGLQKYVEDLANETSKRRAAERTEFSIEQNEFEDDYSLKLLNNLIEDMLKKLAKIKEKSG